MLCNKFPHKILKEQIQIHSSSLDIIKNLKMHKCNKSHHCWNIKPQSNNTSTINFDQCCATYLSHWVISHTLPIDWVKY